MTPEDLAKLTPEVKRAKIVELCPGWRIGDKTWMSTLVHWQDANGVEMLSDPLNDLNAMHEAEMLIRDTYVQSEQYLMWLRKLCVETSEYAKDAASDYATAAQRADAFLLTLG